MGIEVSDFSSVYHLDFPDIRQIHIMDQRIISVTKIGIKID